MIKHIRLIAPSYSLEEKNVELTKEYLGSLGMKVTVPKDLLGDDLLCANQDEIRLAHLKSALIDESIDIIWLLMGGYGLTRLIPDLLKMERPKTRKLYIGFSDGTALHVFLNQIWNWPTIHGIGAIQAARKVVGEESIKKTVEIIEKGLTSYEPPVLIPFNKEADAVSSLSGAVCGGNLCLLQTSLGTKWQIDSSDKILFLEDVSERGYRIDRMLVHLDQAGVFDDVRAVVFGDFTPGYESDGSSLIQPVLERFASSLNVPVFSLPKHGHGPDNYPLPFNVPLEFSVRS